MCSSDLYPTRPFIGIGIVVVKGDHVLLCRRGKAPNIGSWTLPGGAQEVGETCHEAARRELMEETGLAVGDLHALLREVRSPCRHDSSIVRSPRAVAAPR